MAQPQPDPYAILDQHLLEISYELRQLSLLPNNPAFHPQFAQGVEELKQQTAQISQSLGQLNETVVQINQRLKKMDDLLPIRLFNATASLQCPLQYPPGVAIVPALPNTKLKLFDGITVEQCKAAATTLGLAPLGPDATDGEHRQQISDYLGCAMDFRF